MSIEFFLQAHVIKKSRSISCINCFVLKFLLQVSPSVEDAVRLRMDLQLVQKMAEMKIMNLMMVSIMVDISDVMIKIYATMVLLNLNSQVTRSFLLIEA